MPPVLTDHTTCPGRGLIYDIECAQHRHELRHERKEINRLNILTLRKILLYHFIYQRNIDRPSYLIVQCFTFAIYTPGIPESSASVVETQEMLAINLYHAVNGMELGEKTTRAANPARISPSNEKN
jgi:hypothetical protein